MLRSDVGVPRGEAGRVAQRVRDLLQAHEEDVERGNVQPDDPEAFGLGYAGQAEEETDPPLPPVPFARRLAARVPLRLDPGRRSVLALGVAVALAAALTGLWLSSSRPEPMPVSAAIPATSMSGVPSLTPPKSTDSAAPPGTAGSSVPIEIVVDVAGKVRKPGVYRLPPGSRIDDAIKAAGGARHGVDLSSLNLAAVLMDGQQIAVGRPGASAGAAPVGAPGPGRSGGSGDGPVVGRGEPLNLNTATLDQLETLPGIGPALGQRILDYRSEHGSFTGVDQLDDVSGIGTVTFNRLKPLVTV